MSHVTGGPVPRSKFKVTRPHNAQIRNGPRWRQYELQSPAVISFTNMNHIKIKKMLHICHVLTTVDKNKVVIKFKHFNAAKNRSSANFLQYTSTRYYENWLTNRQS